jgi:hypothetical protein
MSKNTKTLTQWCDPDATKATVLTNKSHHAKPFLKAFLFFCQILLIYRQK